MSRKDYEFRASLARTFASELLNTNNKFKTSLFLKACGVAEAAK